VASEAEILDVYFAIPRNLAGVLFVPALSPRASSASLLLLGDPPRIACTLLSVPFDHEGISAVYPTNSAWPGSHGPRSDDDIEGHSSKFHLFLYLK